MCTRQEEIDLVKPLIQEQLENVSVMLEQHKDLQDALVLKKRTLMIQLEIESSKTKGLEIEWENKTVFENLLQNALDRKLPIIYFLNLSKNDIDILKEAFQKLVQMFIEKNIEEQSLRNLLNSIESGKISLKKLIESSLREDIKTIEEVSKETDVKIELLLYILGAIIQPCLEEVARKLDSNFQDKWWEGSCPVCGRLSAVAKNKYGNRFLICTFCGTEYLFDKFYCIHCGNKDPYTLKFITVEKNPAFKIDFCTKCKHYIKVLEETKIKNQIPRGLEDILTVNLDFLAKEAGLIRN